MPRVDKEEGLVHTLGASPPGGGDVVGREPPRPPWVSNEEMEGHRRGLQQEVQGEVAPRKEDTISVRYSGINQLFHTYLRVISFLELLNHVELCQELFKVARDAFHAV